MIYTLDTNAVAEVLRDNATFIRRIANALDRNDGVTLNAITYFETRRGLFPRTFRRKLATFEEFANLFSVLPLDTKALDISADIYQNLRRQGTPIEDADILIAGTAIANDAVLVTRNLKYFERIENLRLESWEA